MATPLQRLYKTKLTLLAVVLTVSGAALLLVNAWAGSQPEWAWLETLKLVEVGVALLTGGALAVLLEYVGKQDADEQLRHELREAIRGEAPAIRDAVVDGFAFAPGSLTRVASAKTLDRIVENTLGIQLGDQELAEDVYGDLREQVIRSKQRIYDAHVSVSLSPWEHGPTSGRGSMFVATVHWEYRTTGAPSAMRFSCVSDLNEYHELLRDPTSTVTWYFEPIAKLNAGSTGVFDLVTFAVNGKQLPTRHLQRTRAQTYTVSLGESTAGGSAEVTVSYTFRVLVQRHSHMLSLDIAKPTKGLKVDFLYGNCGIQYVNLLDYFSSSKQPRVTRLPASGPTPSISLSFDGWVMPKGGAGFVWTLEDELAQRPPTSLST